ncbi:hypothetical protein [Saccharopolyspora dendranthemae]|uniref:Uncharacterized protein n=1 Tax=Saccharopolyspora dendranthemae TaxID=1181886 RepID=A0A561TX29_9PSEU|nr:hypothetical protein [Saccharopolyspora dendranthemae]TWF91659.1 hypothetical protein FHU35_1882 [Saccharopolyspora dendranthemae]
MGDKFYVDPDGLTGVIGSMQHSSDAMGRGSDSPPNPADAGDSTEASAKVLELLLEQTAGAVHAVDELVERVTQVRDEYVTGDHAGAEKISQINPS